MKPIKKNKKHNEEIYIDEFLNDKQDIRKEFNSRKKSRIKLRELVHEASTKDILNTKILNKATNRKIKVASALTYNQSTQVYQLAKALLKKNKTIKHGTFPEFKKPADVVINKLREKYIDLYEKGDENYEAYSAYLHLIEEADKKFGSDIESNKKKSIGIFNFKSENELQNLLGDGQILNINTKLIKKGDPIEVYIWNHTTKRSTVKKEKQKTDEIQLEAITNDGYCTRTIYPNKKLVHMDYFRISPEAPKGTGSNMFFNQVNNFKKMNIKKLETNAAGIGKLESYSGNKKWSPFPFNGYYTWARLGYNLDDKMFNKLIEKSKDSDIKSVKSLSELMTFEKGREYWKNYGFSFHGVFDLSKDSDSMFILKKYINNKNKEKINLKDLIKK